MTVRKKLSKLKIDETAEFPVYSAESSNNGIVGYINNPEFICDEKNPIYINFGDHTRNFNIATKSFSVLDNVKVLLPKINNIRVLQFIISSWKKQIPNLGYSRHWKLAKESSIPLPIKDGEIDFKFMEEFIAELEAERIAELEAERIAELEAYLLAAGLKNTILTAEEEIALESFSTRRFEKFLLKDLFNEIHQGRRLKKDDQLAGNIPFVMSGVTNCGVVGYISNPVASFPKNSITVDIFGNTFYRRYNFGAGDDTGVYWNSEKNYSLETMLFFTAAIEKSLTGKFSYGNKLRSSQSKDFEILLPTKDGEPDYEYMEKFITAVQKIVIADVVKYSEEKISAYRQATNK